MARNRFKVIALITLFMTQILVSPLKQLQSEQTLTTSPGFYLYNDDDGAIITTLDTPLKDEFFNSIIPQKQIRQKGYRHYQLQPQLEIGLSMAKTPPVRMLPVTNMTPKQGMPTPCIPPSVADDILLMFVMCVYFVVSFVYIISGYRCYRFCLFITAFTMASVATYSICEQEKLMSQYLNITVAVIAGILFGMLNTAVQAIGMIVTGLHSGFIGSIVSLTLFNYYVDKGHKTCWLHVLVVVMSSITTGMLSIFRRKVMTIISTSIYGASLLTVCISMYYHKLTSLNWVMQRLKLKHGVEEPCPLSLGLITIWCIVTIFGIIVQCTLTGRGIHHEQNDTSMEEELFQEDRSYRNDVLTVAVETNRYSKKTGRHSTPPFNPRAARRGPPAEIPLPIPSPYCPRRCDFTELCTGTPKDNCIRSMEFGTRRKQYAPKRLNASHCTCIGSRAAPRI